MADNNGADPIHGGHGEMTLPYIGGVFDTKAKDLFDALDKAQKALYTDASNPNTLAEYQRCFQAYTLVRQAQSNVVKAVKDLGAGIIANFR